MNGVAGNVVELPAAAGMWSQPWSLKKLWLMLSAFGPAAVLASLSIGAGETIVVVRTGAWAGYDLLWVILVSCLVKGIVVTYMLGRYTVLSGEYVGHRLVHLPGPRGWLLLFIVGIEVLFAPLAWVAIAKPCGNLADFLCGYDVLAAITPAFAGRVHCQNLYTTLFILAAVITSLSINYQRLEKEQLVICGILVLGTTLGTLMIWPDFAKSLEGTFTRMGRLPDQVPPWAPDDARNFPLLNLATVFAYVGGSVTSYIAYANWVSLRGWGMTGHPDIAAIRRQAAASKRIDYLPTDASARARLGQLLAPLRWDLWLGAAVLFLVTASFMVSGAAALYERQTNFDQWRLLTDQAYVWQAIHPLLVPIYYVTVLAALWGTLIALPEVYARVTHEFFGAIWPQRAWDYHRLRRWIAGWILLEATIVIWADLEFDLLTQVVAFMICNLAFVPLALASIYLNYVLPPAYRVGPLCLAAVIASCGVLATAACLSAVGLLQKFAF